jgi:hypothetical protein
MAEKSLVVQTELWKPIVKKCLLRQENHPHCLGILWRTDDDCPNGDGLSELIDNLIIVVGTFELGTQRKVVPEFPWI